MLESMSRARNQRVSVLIVGAGPVGLCHALWLRQRDVEVLVIDSDARSHRDEWVLLGPEALQLLRRVGVRDELDAIRFEYDAVLLHKLGSKEATRLALPEALMLVSRAALERILENLARAQGAQIEHAQRLQRVDIRATHCEAQIAVLTQVDAESAAGHQATVIETTRRVLAQWVVGTDGRRSIVRRDLHATFRPIAEPRVSSVVRLSGKRSSDTGRAIQIMSNKNTTHTVWPLEPGSLLWVAQTTGAGIPDGIEISQYAALSIDAIQHGTVTDAFIEREARSLGLEVDSVLGRHAIRYRPSTAAPVGRGRAWTSGAAAQVIAPALGVDDTLGLLEVPDLALLLGFGTEDGLSNTPTLTPRLYQERRERLQQHAIGAHPLSYAESILGAWSSRDFEAVTTALPFLARVSLSPSRAGWRPDVAELAGG